MLFPEEFNPTEKEWNSLFPFKCLYFTEYNTSFTWMKSIALDSLSRTLAKHRPKYGVLIDVGIVYRLLYVESAHNGCLPGSRHSPPGHHASGKVASLDCALRLFFLRTCVGILRTMEDGGLRG